MHPVSCNSQRSPHTRTHTRTHAHTHTHTHTEEISELIYTAFAVTPLTSSCNSVMTCWKRMSRSKVIGSLGWHTGWKLYSTPGGAVQETSFTVYIPE